MTTAIVLAGLLLLPPALDAGQGTRAAVSGHVTTVDGRDAANAVVRILDTRGLAVADTRTDDRGRFHFDAVAIGTYSLVADTSDERARAIPLAVETAYPINLEIRLAPRLEASVVVRAGPESPAVASRATLSGDAIRQAPARLGSRALQQALATMPGWSSEDNGLLHVRGVDDGVLFVEDGVPVYDRIDPVFGIAPAAAAIGSLNVITGYIPAEHGLKAGAVVEVQSARRQDAWSALGSVGGGSNDTTGTQLTAGGPLGARVGLGLDLAAERSSRFLDPVHPDNLHNRGGARAGTARADATLGARDRLTASAQTGRARFEVPHGTLQEAAGQDQRQTLRQQAQTASWQRVWSGAAVSHVAGYHRRIHAQLTDTPAATPLFAASDRRHDRVGAVANLTVERGRHTLKVGAEAARLSLDERFTFAVTDADDGEEAGLSEAALAFSPAQPFVFAGDAARNQIAAYLQDRVRIAGGLTLEAGLRLDRTRLLMPASGWSPRVGAAFQRPGSATTFRASYNRFFQPPQPEHLLLSSSPEARVLSPFAQPAEDGDEDGDGDGGGADLAPERQHAFEVGLDHVVGTIGRISAAAWRRDVRNYADPNVFFGTTIVFPNSVASGRAQGLDLRVDVPGTRGWSSFLTYTLSKVEQTGPINGGLFLEDEIGEIDAGTTFTPDHDQRHAAAAGLTFAPAARRIVATAMARYESGTPLDVGDLDDDDAADLAERPGAELVDLVRGRVRPRLVVDLAVTTRLARLARVEMSVRASVLNLTNRAYAFNFGNPFSGTHFGAPRTLRLDAQVAFD